MASKIVKIKVPDSISDRYVKFIVAVELYREGRISLCEAACIAEMDLWNFLYEIGKRKASFINVNLKELEKKVL